MMEPSRPDEQGPLDVLVIGAGQAGLALASHLRRAGVEFLLVDAGPAVGHAWRARWDSLRLFSAAEYNSLPGMPFPARAGTYPTKDQVADYLAAYAETFQLPVRLGTRVTCLRKSSEHFIAETTTGVITARQVVVATGAFASPRIPPDLAGGLAPEVVQLHSSQYKRAAELPSGSVLVVGAGNSGVQIAAELVGAGRSASLAVGTRPRMVPQKPLGRDVFWWLTVLGLARMPSDSGPTARARARDRIVGILWQRLTSLGARVRSDAEGATPDAAIGFVIGTSWRRLRALGVAVRPRAVKASGTTVEFADGSTLEVGAVVWATGFRSEHPWMDVPGAIVDGRLMHTGGVSAVPGLYFLGLPWQRSRSSDWLGFVSADAAWLAERLLPHAPKVPVAITQGLPSAADTDSKTVDTRTWTRVRFLSGGRTASPRAPVPLPDVEQSRDSTA